jgi:hypothetical protein
MQLYKSVIVFCCSILLLFISAWGQKINRLPLAEDIKALKFLGEYVIPFNMQYKNTTVGGLSGIDYDAKNNLYYLICDDRSDKNPARFYTAKIFITKKGIDSMRFTGVTNMLQPNNTAYPNNKQNAWHTPDPEAIRYNPVTKQLVWSSEGERIVKEKDTILANPSVIQIAKNGLFKNNFELPANFYMQATINGPRQNGVFEGMSFANNYKTLFVNIEEPLYEDGPRADTIDNDAYIRILKFDAASKKNTAQYAYELDPVAHPANPITAFKVNGVPDILSIGNNKLLVIERSFSTGRLPCTIKIFVADISVATNISNITSLQANKDFKPATKKLLMNMDSLGIYTDNIEGVTFGPLLPNGHKTLVFIADNNFNLLQQSQVFLFEVIE